MQFTNLIIITFFGLIIFYTNFTTEIVNLERVNTKSSSFEVKLVSWSNKKVFNEMKFSNFDDFKVIKFWTFNVSRYKHATYEVYFHFLPNKRITLDIKIKHDDFKYFKVAIIYYYFYFIKGFDVDTFSLDLASFIRKNICVYFYISNFMLFKKEKIIDKSNCNFVWNHNYFNKLDILKFGYGIKYSENTCKFIFKNSHINEINLFSLTDSFVKRNKLGFIGKETTSINSSIEAAFFHFYKMNVDRKLLDSNVFEKVQFIVFDGEINKIEDNLFFQLNLVHSVKLEILNLRKLFSKGIKWINSLAMVRISNMSNITEIVRKLENSTMIGTYVIQHRYENYNYKTLQKPYLYPDEDFCWYANFPFDRLVFLDPHTYCLANNCSCTQHWLLQYAYLINLSQNALQYLNVFSNDDYTFQFSEYKLEIERCHFHQRLKYCQENIFSTQIDQVSSSFMSALVDSQLVDFIVVILTTLLSTIGIIVNVVNIIVISNIHLNKTSEEKQQQTLIRFMLVYSITNLFYCVIDLCSLISKCIDFNSLFCSELFLTQFAQWYKVILVEFVGSNLKTLSNVVYFCISLNRYVLLETESKLAHFIKGSIGEWSTKKKTLWAVFWATILIALNSHKIIIYKVLDNSITAALFGFNPELFFTMPFFLSNSQTYRFDFNYLTEREVNDRSIVYEVFTYVNFVLNDVVFYLGFTVVDILLVIAFKRATEKKKTIYKDKLNDEKIQKILTDMEQNGKKIMRVIIVNICILLVIKVFDLFMSVSKFKIWKDDLAAIYITRILNAFCYTSKICSVYEELVKLLYVLHYSFSIVCFYFLNKNFKINLKTMLGRKNIE